jgi:CsoR family transcriptional regulator, copper-sensing transcriptional repressor
MVDPTPGGVDRPDERKTMLPVAKRDALNRLKTVRGHLDGIIRMVEEDAYCVDLMKQVSAAQASLERVNRLVLKNHLETCFAETVAEGRSQAAVAELVDAVKFNPVLTGPEASLSGSATNEARAAPGGTGGGHR